MPVVGEGTAGVTLGHNTTAPAPAAPAAFVPPAPRKRGRPAGTKLNQRPCATRRVSSRRVSSRAQDVQVAAVSGLSSPLPTALEISTPLPVPLPRASTNQATVPQRRRGRPKGVKSGVQPNLDLLSVHSVGDVSGPRVSKREVTQTRHFSFDGQEGYHHARGWRGRAAEATVAHTKEVRTSVAALSACLTYVPVLLQKFASMEQQIASLEQLLEIHTDSTVITAATAVCTHQLLRPPTDTASTLRMAANTRSCGSQSSTVSSRG